MHAEGYLMLYIPTHKVIHSRSKGRAIVIIVIHLFAIGLQRCKPKRLLLKAMMR